MANNSTNGQQFMGRTLEPARNMSPKNDTEERSVQSALFCIGAARDTKVIRDSRNFLIQELFESGFQIKSPTTPQRINSKILQQAFWRTANRMKPLDFEIFGSGRPEVNRRIVTAGVATVMERGGYTRALRDKGGAFQKALMWGDGFVHFGSNPDPDADFPIVYTPISNSNIYTDSYSTAMRAGGIGRSVRKCAVIFSMSWATFCERYPKGKKIAAAGKVPRDQGFYKELERTYIQTNKMYDIIEVCHFYDLDAKCFVTFAGPTCAILEEFKGEKYPFTKGDGKEPYIPILQFICMPSTEGIYNHGIGDMFFDIAMFASQLMNMGFNHIADNADPFTFISTPKGETAKLFNSMRAAGEMRAAGKRPVIPMEFDPENPNGSRVSMEALTTQNMAEELDKSLDYLSREIARMGINLDDVEYGADVTAHQIVAEQSSQNSFVQQIMEYNASETQFAVETAMDMICKLVSSKDKTPLNLTTEIQMPDGTPMKADEITLGAVRDELKKFNYFAEINARTGAQPSTLLEQAHLEKMLPLAAPGSKAQSSLLESYAELNNVDIPASAFAMPAQGQQPGQGAPQPQQGQTAQGPQMPALAPAQGQPAIASAA